MANYVIVGYLGIGTITCAIVLNSANDKYVEAILIGFLD